MDQRISRRETLPQILVAVALFISVLTALMGWISYQSSMALIAFQEKHVKLTLLRGEILHLDEVLTMSARMAAATGDPRWERRYRQFEPVLDTKIKQSLAMAPEASQFSSAKVTDDANLKLVEMEKRAFELVRRGQVRRAAEVLFSEAYESQKKTYADGAQQTNEKITAMSRTELARHEARLGRCQIFTLLFLVLSVLGWIYVLRSIREGSEALRQLNERLDRDVREKSAQLFAASKMTALGEMAGGVAHEINNPLAIIHGQARIALSLMAQPPVELEPIKAKIGKIVDTAERIARIVQGLRAFAREGAHDAFELANVGTIIDDTLALCTDKLKQNAVAMFIGERRVVQLECRPVQISQVVLNLISNSVDALSDCPEKWIRLEIVEGESDVEIRVTDSGHPIPEPIRDKIMAPFFTTKKVGKGTGLGLSISKGLVETHGGELYLDTAARNTCFVIRLPKQQSGAAPHEPEGRFAA